MLNSLFGRLALKESDNELKVMKNIDQEDLDLVYTKAKILYQKENTKLVKTYGEVPKDILSLIEKERKIKRQASFRVREMNTFCCVHLSV